MVAAVLHLHERARAALDAVDEVCGGFLHRHDVVDAAFLLGSEPERRSSKNIALLGPELRPDLAIIAGYERDLGHVREGVRLGLGRAAGHHDLRIGALALEAADALPRLPHGFRRHRAGVDDDGIFHAGLRGGVADHLQLVGVEPAAECDDVDAHATAANSAGSNRPSYSNATGPVIRT